MPTNMDMDIDSIVLRLHRMRAWMERDEAHPNRARTFHERPPFGLAEISIDPTSTERAASLNRNRIYLAGRRGGLTHDGLIELVQTFKANGVDRFFVWLSPGPELSLVRSWLTDLGMERVTWSRYPTLALLERDRPTLSSGLEIRKVGRDEIVAARMRFGLETMAGFEEAAGREGFHHYLAFDGNGPIASAMLVTFEGMGYLTHAQTSEAKRGLGAQTALIVRRTEHAQRLGCDCMVSQTLTMLSSSMSNLQRCGFREIYDCEVYECASQ